MFPNDPAVDIDRLARLRACIRDLRCEEAQMRDRLLTLRDGVHLGAGHRVRIETKRQRHLDRAALPNAVLSDPRLWREREGRVVRFIEDRDDSSIWGRRSDSASAIRAPIRAC